MSEPTAKIETITPEVAKKMLATNSNNRNMSERSLNHYIRQIEEGQWEFNGDTIRFANDGTLLDGQHRLHAIIQTKKSLKCLIVRGLKKSVMSTIDTGKGRTIADHLKLQNRFNIHYYAATAAAIGIIFRFRKGKYVESHERMTPAEAISFVEQNPGILKSVQAANKTELVKLTTPSIAISCHYLFTKVDKFKAEEFFDRLTTGENLGKSSPILKLRTALQGMRSATQRRGSLKQRTFLYYMCAAFEAYLHGRRIDGFEKFAADSVIEVPKRGGG